MGLLLFSQISGFKGSFFYLHGKIIYFMKGNIHAMICFKQLKNRVHSGSATFNSGPGVKLLAAKRATAGCGCTHE